MAKVSMATKKYPIGTSIIFIANKNMCSDAKLDDGKMGTIIGETSHGSVKVFLPNSVKNYGNKKIWYTSWNNIKPAFVKNEQLLFSFMD